MLGAERFLREIETTAGLRHPHILPLYDSGEAAGFVFYVMPFVEGETLRDTLRRLKQLPIADAVRIAREVADALSYAHDRGVIHRDVKPENILLERGHAVVADFGIAKAVSGIDDGRLTQTGIAVGTPAYMSPEQALAEARIDGRSDLYSLGCLLFEMLAGEAPFAAPTPQRTIARRLTEPPPAVTAIRADVDPRLSRLLEHVLAADPADRPPTAAAFVASLVEIDRGASSRAAETDGSASTARSGAVAIAVLPFSDLSATKDQQYLCEGMAEEIMTALGAIGGIRVASRSSAFRAKQDNTNLPAIARLLSVNHVLDGSVRTAGARLRATAELTEIASGYQVWSQRFDRETTDVFAVQDEIAAGVVDAVRARLAPGMHTVKGRPHLKNLEAYRSYLKGRHLRYVKEDPIGAIRALEEATRLDPTHAPSWTALAEALALAALFGAIPARDACTAARHALATAVRLEGETADSLHGEGWLGLIERRWPAMEAAWRGAIERQPNHALALGSFGISLCVCRKQDEGLRLLERAREVDPLASFPYMLTAFAMFFGGNPAGAHQYAEDALGFEKEDASALMALVMAQIALERFDEGIRTAERLAALTHRSRFHVGLLGWALATAGRATEARQLLEELRTLPGSANMSEGWLLGALGERDQAFAVLARAEAEYQTYLCFHGLPTFDSLRDDPRFTALLNRLGLD